MRWLKHRRLLYDRPTPPFAEYARLRADAMRLYDDAGQHPNGATEADWQRIEQALNRAWRNLHGVVQPTTDRP